MNEKNVEFISTLLGIDADAVKGAVEDGTLSDKFTAAGLMSKADVETLKTNLSREVKSSHLTELEELAKKGELPQELYKPINGAVLEKLEKKLSKEYNVSDYVGVDDLIAKAIKNTAKPDDTKLQEHLDKITALKQANETLVSEKDDAIKSANDEKNSWILNREKSDNINQMPFDFSDVEEKELDAVTAKRRGIVESVFDAQYTLGLKDEKVTVFKDGNPLLNEATFDPVPISDVLKKTALELGLKLKSPETGGQGGSSSSNNGSRFKDVDEFTTYCQGKGINPTSSEGLKILNDSGLKII